MSGSAGYKLQNADTTRLKEGLSNEEIDSMLLPWIKDHADYLGGTLS